MRKILKNTAAIFFTVLFVLTLAACSNNKKSSQPKEKLPSATTILNGAQNTKFKSMTATWTQTDDKGDALQRAKAQYQKKPLVVFADFSTESNHYKMWIDGKHNYMQMQGTATNKWFKTKVTKASSYAQLTADLAQSALLSFSQNSAKLFKVKKIDNGYLLAYSGNNKKIWKSVTQNSMITSVIGIDLDNVKPYNTEVKISTDKKYNLTKTTIDAAYKDDGQVKHLKLNIDGINKNSNLKIPNAVTKSAVELGK